MNEPTRGKIIVRSNSVFDAPLYEGNQASMIEVYNADNDLMAILVRILSEDTWGLSTKDDEDWEAMLVRFGLTGKAKNNA